jgi:hypothetical protein
MVGTDLWWMAFNFVLIKKMEKKLFWEGDMETLLVALRRAIDSKMEIF